MSTHLHHLGCRPARYGGAFPVTGRPDRPDRLPLAAVAVGPHPIGAGTSPADYGRRGPATAPVDPGRRRG
jgi:hypothetical protein